MSIGGGTNISSGYALIDTLLETEYNPDEWNLYIFQGTDGENFTDDTALCIEILQQKLLKHLNLLGINIVQPYSWGNWATYEGDIQKEFGEDHDIVRTAKTESEDDIGNTIKTFLGKKED